ncbi:hypothetical protein TRVA0_045S00100 [Trichomonascus vanleenenianus]|uniref:uncharacterized protein n=1 Tax=Trichomonascus vanleenenianus TaxID=2268995 RepID=UPI003EC9CFCE
MSEIERAISQLESSFVAFLTQLKAFSYSESDVDSGSDGGWTMVSERRVKAAKGLAAAYHDGKLPWINELLVENQNKPSLVENAPAELEVDEHLIEATKNLTIGDSLNVIFSSSPIEENKHAEVTICSKCQKEVHRLERSLSANAYPSLSSSALYGTVKLGLILHEGTNEREKYSHDRLKFLGAGIYYGFVSKAIFERFPHMSIHHMTTLRSILVSNSMQFRWASQTGLASGFLEAGDWNSKQFKEIAATMNAYMGAVAVDTEDGMEKIEAWLSKLVEPFISVTTGESEQKEPLNPNAIRAIERIYPAGLLNYKTSIEKGRNNLELIQVRARKKVLGRGFGRNTNEAMTRAAMDALQTRDKIRDAIL